MERGDCVCVCVCVRACVGRAWRDGERIGTVSVASSAAIVCKQEHDKGDKAMHSYSHKLLTEATSWKHYAG